MYWLLFEGPGGAEFRPEVPLFSGKGEPAGFPLLPLTVVPCFGGKRVSSSRWIRWTRTNTFAGVTEFERLGTGPECFYTNDQQCPSGPVFRTYSATGLHGACRAQSTLEIGNTKMAFLTIKTNGNSPANTPALGGTADTVLLGKFKVDSMLLEIVQSNFEDILPNLMEGGEYTAEDLVGAALWGDWTLLGQRQAHLCLKHLATLPGARLTDMASVECGKTGFQIV